MRTTVVELPEGIADRRPEIMDQVRSMRELIERSADANEQANCLSDEVIEALDGSDLLNLVAPRVLGGVEAHPLLVIDVLRELSYYDGSTGWYVGAVITGAAVAGAYLGDRAVEAIFANGKPRCAGQAAPTGKAERVGDGYRISGSYSFGSGTPSANWIVGGYVLHENGTPVKLENGEPRMLIAMAPRSKVEFLGNWDVLGLRGTASFDFRVPEQIVHEDFVFDPTTAVPRRGGALYKMGFMALPCMHHGSVALGCTVRALDEWAHFAKTKVRFPGGHANKQHTLQRDLALGSGEIRAAESYMRRTNADIYDHAARGSAVPDQLRIDARLAASVATAVGARVTQSAFMSCTTTALRNSSRLQRCYRDAQACTAHFLTGEQSLVESGSVLAGASTIIKF